MVTYGHSMMLGGLRLWLMLPPPEQVRDKKATEDFKPKGCQVKIVRVGPPAPLTANVNVSKIMTQAL